MGIYGDKEMKKFTKELNAFYKAKAELKTKIINYLDSLDEDIDICITLDCEETFFIKISGQQLESKIGFKADYRGFTTEELIDVLEEIVKYHDEEKQKRLEE